MTTTLASSLVWSQFHDLFWPDLRIGIQTPLEIDDDFEDERYRENKMINVFRPGGKQFVFHPALKTDSDLEYKSEMQIVIIPQFNVSDCAFHQLVVSRTNFGQRAPWVVAARFPNKVHDEKEVFGFSSINSRNDNYLNLAFPGEVKDENDKPIFAPLYLKVQKPGEDEFVYILIYAEERHFENEEKSVFWVILAKIVREIDAPVVLRKAKPPAHLKTY